MLLVDGDCERQSKGGEEEGASGSYIITLRSLRVVVGRCEQVDRPSLCTAALEERTSFNPLVEAGGGVRRSEISTQIHPQRPAPFARRSRSLLPGDTASCSALRAAAAWTPSSGTVGGRIEKMIPDRAVPLRPWCPPLSGGFSVR